MWSCSFTTVQTFVTKCKGFYDHTEFRYIYMPCVGICRKYNQLLHCENGNNSNILGFLGHNVDVTGTCWNLLNHQQKSHLKIKHVRTVLVLSYCIISATESHDVTSGHAVFPLASVPYRTVIQQQESVSTAPETSVMTIQIVMFLLRKALSQGWVFGY